MHQLTRGAELVDRSRADAQVRGDLANRQELLAEFEGSRGHRGDKSSLVGRSIHSFSCIGSLGAPNDVERLRLNDTGCQLIRGRRIELGCKWSLVQIQSPRPFLLL